MQVQQESPLRRMVSMRSSQVDPSQLLQKEAGVLGTGHEIHTVECYAALAGVKQVVEERSKVRDVELRLQGDSESVVKVIAPEDNGTISGKDAVSFIEQLHELLSSFKTVECEVIEQGENRRADALASRVSLD